MIAIGLLFVRLLSDCFKSRRRLEAEILVLRHQLSVLQQRAARRLHLRWADARSEHAVRCAACRWGLALGIGSAAGFIAQLPSRSLALEAQGFITRKRRNAAATWRAGFLREGLGHVAVSNRTNKCTAGDQRSIFPEHDVERAEDRRDVGQHARGAAAGAGYRNGYRRGRLKTAEGVVEYAAPQICDRAVPFRSRLREIIRGRTEELEALAVEMYARGLSTRDIEALFVDEDGRSLLSRTAVSEVTERLWAQYEAFASRDLSEFEVIYLFVDGIAERLHLGQPREAVLAAWGVLADGYKVLLHLAPGSKEDTASCREFFQDMRRRGLPDPLLVISDGAPG